MSVCECGHPIDAREIGWRNVECIICGDDIHIGGQHSTQGVEVKLKWKCEYGKSHVVLGRRHSKSANAYHMKICQQKSLN